MKTPEQYEAVRAEKKKLIQERYKRDEDCAGDGIPVRDIALENVISVTWLIEILDEMNVEIDNADEPGRELAWVTRL